MDLTAADQVREAEAAFAGVFAKANHTDPFRDTVAARLLIYPIDYIRLTREQFAAVARASIADGVRHALLAGQGGEQRGWSGTYGHRLVDLTRYDDYRSGGEASTLEHFLFAPGSEWGLVTSDAEYALLGGGAAFIATVRSLLQYDEDRVVRQFLSDWREMTRAGAHGAWVPTMLNHVFGPRSAWRRWPEPE